MTWLRAGAAVVASLLAALFAVGCALAFVFELHGFGGDRDASARPLVLIGWSLLGTGLLVAAFLLWRWLLPGAWALGLVALFGGVVASVVLLGLVG